MAGFLDRNTRIIDMVLTNQGRKLLSRGQLRFCYWIPFDDEIDYTPYIAESGSLSEETLSRMIDTSIEDTPIREAVAGYKDLNFSGSDNVNVHRPMFTMPQGKTVLPRAVFPDDSERTIQTFQRKVEVVYQNPGNGGRVGGNVGTRDVGIERWSPSTFNLELSYAKDSYPPDVQQQGFHIRIFKSGSEGLVEVLPRRDMSNDISYNNDVRIFTGQREE